MSTDDPLQGSPDEAAAIVKGVHADLREKCRRKGHDAGSSWLAHCKDDKLLEKYAKAMHCLATRHWSAQDRLLSDDRIAWTYSVCVEYFHGGGLEKALGKDERRQRHHEENSKTQSCPVNSCESSHPKKKEEISGTFGGRKMRLLDVGSCYNPFSEFSEFESLAIDIAPAVQSVHKCDFLRLTLLEEEPDSEELNPSFSNPLTKLSKNLFHIVVFSLLLSYMPTPEQRWLCCVNAHGLLKTGGILVVITPDSGHQNRNAPMMVSWRKAIESIGFRRWRYEKRTHLHCMVFRKIQGEVGGEALGPEGLFIPQDQGGEESDPVTLDSRTGTEDIQLVDNFSELPDYCSDSD